MVSKGKMSVGNSMDHLSCFMGGILALGAYTDPKGLQSKRAKRDLKTSKGLVYTCYQMYASMPTGLSPERITFNSRIDCELEAIEKQYTLRPEVMESLFILHQLTEDDIYRQWGWDIYLLINIAVLAMHLVVIGM